MTCHHFHPLSLQLDRKHPPDQQGDKQMFLQRPGQDQSQESHEGACQRGGGVRHRVAGDTGGLVEAAQNVQEAQRDRAGGGGHRGEVLGVLGMRLRSSPVGMPTHGSVMARYTKNQIQS